MTNENFDITPIDLENNDETLEKKKSIEQEREQAMQLQISQIKDIEQLISFVGSVDEIKGTSDSYVFRGSELAQIIKAIKEKDTDIHGAYVPLEAVTRTWGIRDKVYELLGDDVVSEELDERKKEQEIISQQEVVEEISSNTDEQKEEEIPVTPIEEKKPEENPAQEFDSKHNQKLEEAMSKCDTLYSAYQTIESHLHRKKKEHDELGRFQRMIDFEGKKSIARLSSKLKEAFAEYEEAEKEYLALKGELVKK